MINYYSTCGCGAKTRAILPLNSHTTHKLVSMALFSHTLINRATYHPSLPSNSTPYQVNNAIFSIICGDSLIFLQIYRNLLFRFKKKFHTHYSPMFTCPIFFSKLFKFKLEFKLNFNLEHLECNLSLKFNLSVQFNFRT